MGQRIRSKTDTKLQNKSIGIKFILVHSSSEPETESKLDGSRADINGGKQELKLNGTPSRRRTAFKGQPAGTEIIDLRPIAVNILPENDLAAITCSCKNRKPSAKILTDSETGVHDRNRTTSGRPEVTTFARPVRIAEIGPGATGEIAAEPGIDAPRAIFYEYADGTSEG